MFKKRFVQKLKYVLSNVKYGSLEIIFPDNTHQKFVGKENGVNADICIYNWIVFINAFQKADIGLAKDFMRGYWQSSNLEHLFRFFLANQEVIDNYASGNKIFKWLIRLNYFFRRNTIYRSKKNIQIHYDLGNDFYQLWLDDSMTYSGALFIDPNDTLEIAQNRKYTRILDKITLNSHILEIGCGWGGFAKLASQKGHKVEAITLSKNQFTYVKNNVIDNNINVQLQDYRHQSGKFDIIVSIEMFEAVGSQYWHVYFKQLKHLIKSNGSIFLQIITIKDELFKQYSAGTDMIRSYIFPGGMLISEEYLQNLISQHGFKCVDIFKFGKSYAQTLRLWLNKFMIKKGVIQRLGYSEEFLRLWEFYLNYCTAGFEHEQTNLIQLHLKPVN